MYLSAVLSIDPSQLTHVRRKPTKGFQRLAELLTGNLLSEKEEHETFTAVAIMQEINMVLRSLGVTDVVKFTKDGRILYEDPTSTNADDMALALDTLARESRGTPDGVFSEITMLVEHLLSRVAVIIEIRVRRVHDVGAYPIRISINGLDAQLQSAAGTGALNDRLEEVFSSQQSYDGYTQTIRQEFDQFVDNFEQAIRSKMRVDNLHRREATNVVRPGLELPPPVKPAAGNSNQEASEPAPVFQRYGATAPDALMYMWMWSSFMNSHNTYCHHTTVVSEQGQPAFSVGDEGFHAAESAALNPQEPFELPDCPVSDVSGAIAGEDSLTGTSEAGEITSESDLDMLPADSSETQRSGWLDFFSFGDAGNSGHDGGQDGSSCGGASCGSSCGGGCGSGD